MTTIDARPDATVPTSSLPAPTTLARPPRQRQMSESDLRRRELGAFLRSRRERLTPADVGLPPGGRRRTPGLRREEVASLAGVGMTWYTWLEQGRDINASDQVLEAIARTLLLDGHERAHLFTLAGVASAASVADTDCVSPEIRAVLEQLNPYPAFVTNARYDLLAYNHAYLSVLGDIDALPVEERNTVWVVFTKETTARCFVDRDEAKRRMVAQLRGSMAEHIAEPAFKCLVRRLQEASPEFRELWARHEVAEPENARKRILHRDFGLLQFNYLNTWLAPRTGLRLVTYIPADGPTREATALFEGVTPGPIV